MRKYLIVRGKPGHLTRDPHVDHRRYLGMSRNADVPLTAPRAEQYEPEPMAIACHAVVDKALRNGDIEKLNDGYIVAESAADAMNIWNEEES